MEFHWKSIGILLEYHWNITRATGEQRATTTPSTGS
jgi:hypothetical protein